MIKHRPDDTRRVLVHGLDYLTVRIFRLADVESRETHRDGDEYRRISELLPRAYPVQQHARVSEREAMKRRPKKCIKKAARNPQK